MKLKYKLLFILTFLVGSVNYSKGDIWLGHKGINLIGSYQWQRLHGFELGIANAQRGDELGSMFYGNYHLCGEFYPRNNSNSVYGIKAGLSGTAAFINSAFQCIYYFQDSKKPSLYIRPEIGPTFFGIVDLNIGWNIPLVNKNDNLNSIILVLRFTYDPPKWRRTH